MKPAAGWKPGLRELGLGALEAALPWIKPPRKPRPGPPRKILLFKPDHLGDVILTSSLVRTLKAEWPGAEVVYLTKASNLGALTLMPWIDRVEPLDIPWTSHSFQSKASLGEVYGKAQSLRDQDFDAVLCLQDDPRSFVFAYLVGAPFRSGIPLRGGDRLLSHPLSTEPLHTEARHLAHAFALGAREAQPFGLEVPGALRQEARQDLEARLGPGPFLSVHLGAGHPEKRLEAKVLRPLLVGLAASLEVPLLGIVGPGEEALWESLELEAEPRIHRAPPLSVPELGAWLSWARLHFGHDSGPSHLAAGVGTPVVSVFGPSLPEIWAPVSPRGLALKRRDCEVPCRPQPPSPCPCFRSWTAADLLAEVQSHWERLSP